MNRSVITLRGLDILNNSIAGGDTTQYWIGYYGLAYIPEENRQDFSKSMVTLVPRVNGKPIGDELFNIFQGSMADTVAGFDEGDVDSAAGKLYKQCLYAENIESSFRYALSTDNKGNKINTLVTYGQDASDPSQYTLFRTYLGVGGEMTPSNAESNIQVDEYGLPLPAPLYYAAKNDTPVTNSVTPDMRNYAEKTGEPGWSASNETLRTEGGDIATTAAMQSISNFNRYHAPSSSEGYAVAHDPACRNMAKVTKYFPIDHYDMSTIIRDGGHIQNLEAGKSSTNLDNAKVGTVKYKISINIADYMKMSSQRINNPDAPKISFKFNRIGLYAVPVTLHAFNVVAAGNEKCGGNKVQLEVNGDEDPILFAVIDTDTIEMSESGLTKFNIDFSVNFQEDTALVNDPVIFYNLYENDAITWYKNQLLANASTSEAVTTLGVELNYLRNMVEALNSRGADCGVGDDGDMWAFRNHTHPYMRNIVDSADVNFGAVRGIYTMPEYENYTVYLTRGNWYDDTTDPSTVEKLIEVNGYTVGENSMVLGKDSLAAGKYSINMSNYGLIDQDSSHVLLMGGKGKYDGKVFNDDHLAVTDSHNSIINVGNSGELQYLRGSIWMSSDSPVYVNGTAQNTIALGHNDVLNDADGSAYKGDYKNGSTRESVFIGRNKAISQVEDSLIIGAGTWGGTQTIGSYDIASDMNPYYMSSQNYSETSIFPSVTSGVFAVSSIGSMNTVQRNARGIYAIGTDSVIPSRSGNVLMLGNRMNKPSTTYSFAKDGIMTVDEFNERYGNTARWPYPSDDFIWTTTDTSGTYPVYKNNIVVVGTGTINLLNGQSGTPSVTQRSVKGVTLYITYSNYVWNGGITCGTGTGTFGSYPEYYSNLYQKPGNLKNVIMLGDDLSVGYGSTNSIIIGDKSGTRKIKYTNSFINTLGDDIGYQRDNTPGPFGHFDNVWWIGHTNTTQDTSISGSSTTTGHLIVAQNSSVESWHNAVYKDRFVFIGSDPKAYGFSYWYGVDSGLTNNVYGSVNSTNTLGWSYTFDDAYSPCKAPMIYTGGVSLGGYGTRECNFMLLKIGTSRASDGSTYVVNYYNGYNTLPNMMTYGGGASKIIRSSALQGPWTETETNTTYLWKNKSVSDDHLEIGSTTYTYTVPSTQVVNSSVTPTISLYKIRYFSDGVTEYTGDKICDMTVTVDGNVFTGTIPSALSERAIIEVKYNYYDTAGTAIYDYYNTDVQNGHHLMMDCPYKGMALVVQDKQELDGTLHVGLGLAGSSSTVYGNQKFVYAKCNYVNNAFEITLGGAITASLRLPGTYNKDEQDLNTDYQLESKYGGFELYGTIRFTQQGNTGTKPDTSTNSIEATFKSLQFCYDLDAGYMISVIENGSSSSHVSYTPENNIICGYGGMLLRPTYIYITDSAETVFKYIERPMVTTNGYTIYIKTNQTVATESDTMYRITPVEWRDTSGNLITVSGSGRHSGTIYPCRSEKLKGDSASAEGVSLE